MSQCILCQWLISSGHPKGKGKCWQDAKATGKLLDMLEVRKCNQYKLAPIIQVHARSQRRFVFKDDVVTLI